MVRAKFRCVEVGQISTSYGQGPAPVSAERIKLSAVTGPGNEDWSKWTPSGELNFSITNPDAMKQFEAGKDYFIDFSPVEA